MGRQPAKIRLNAPRVNADQKMADAGRKSLWRIWVVVAGGVFVSTAVIGWGYWRIHYLRLAPDAIWERAQQNFRAGRYEEVAADLQRLGRLRVPTTLDWFLSGELAAIRNQLDEACADLARVPDDHQVAAQARLIAGQVERRRGRMRFAEEAFRAAIRLDPSPVQAHRELISIYGIQLRRPEINREFLALQKLTSLTFDDVYHWTSLRNNCWEPGDVVEDLMRFVAADPLDRWSRLALAEIFRRMGRHEQAESTLAALSEDDPEANVVRVRLAVDCQQTEKAEKLLAGGRKDDAGLAPLRGREALARGDANAAVHQFRIAYAADPADHEILFGLWVALERLHDEKAAAPIRKAAGELDRLNTLLQRGRVADARKNLDLLREFGTRCAALHRDAEARGWFEAAIAGNPLDSQSQQALFMLTGGRAGDAASSPDAH